MLGKNNKKFDALSWSAIGGLFLGMLGSMAVSYLIVENYVIIPNLNEHYLVGDKNAYVLTTDKDSGRTTLHEANIKHINDDKDCKDRVDVNSLKFKCGGVDVTNQYIKIAEQHPQENEYDNVCSECSNIVK